MAQAAVSKETDKYLLTILDGKFTFDANTDCIYRKAKLRLFFSRKLRSFNV